MKSRKPHKACVSHLCQGGSLHLAHGPVHPRILCLEQFFTWIVFRRCDWCEIICKWCYSQWCRCHTPLKVINKGLLMDCCPSVVQKFVRICSCWGGLMSCLIKVTMVSDFMTPKTSSALYWRKKQLQARNLISQWDMSHMHWNALTHALYTHCLVRLLHSVMGFHCETYGHTKLSLKYVSLW